MSNPISLTQPSLGQLPPPPPPAAHRPGSAGLGTRTMKWLDHWLGLPLCFACSLVARAARRILPERNRDLRDGDAIAVFKFFGLGSIMQATPLLHSIRRRYPRSRLIFVTFSANRPLLERLHVCSDVCDIRTDSLICFAADTLRQLIRLRRARVRAVIDLEFFSKFSTLLATFTGAPRRIAFHLNDFWRYSLITHPIYFNYFHHVSDLYRHAASRIGIQENGGSPAGGGAHEIPPLTTPPEAKASVQKSLESHGWREGRLLLGVNVNAGDVSLERRWPLERFAEVLASFLRQHPDGHAVLTGAPAERAYTASLIPMLPADVVPRVFLAAGVWSLDEFLAALDLFDAFLTNDSGPMHLAAAQRTPMVSLWGPGRPAFYSPAYPEHIEIYENFACSPCLYMFTTFEGMWCGHQGWCMSAIEPPRVLAALERLMAHPPSGG